MKRTTVTKKRLGTRTKYELPTFEAEAVQLTRAELESIMARLIVEDPEAEIVRCIDCPWVGRPPGPRMTGRVHGAVPIPLAICPECDSNGLFILKLKGAYRA